MELANGWCSRCEVVVDFDRPVCDEHDDCPELVCVLCGAAYFGGDFYVFAAINTTPTSAVVTPAA